MSLLEKSIGRQPTTKKKVITKPVKKQPKTQKPKTTKTGKPTDIKEGGEANGDTAASA